MGDTGTHETSPHRAWHALVAALMEAARIPHLVEWLTRLLTAERDAARAEAATLRTQYRDLATYRTAHANLGLCPEGSDDEARDPDCPVCRVLVAHEGGIRGRERAAFAALLDAEDDEE